MAYDSVGVIFLLSHLVLLVSAQEQGGQSCPSSFQCGTRGVFGYPFTTIFKPSCGVCILNCTEPVSTIRLARKGPWYDITNSFSNNRTFLVSDLSLLHVVNANSCDMFDESMELPRSPSISITIIRNETLWKCSRTFNISDHRNTSAIPLLYIHSCGNYYIYRHDNVLDPLPRCSPLPYVVQLIVELSDQCSQCITEGGRCHDLKNGEFKCIKKKKGTNSKKLYICVCECTGINSQLQ